jgi:hypothetical protein
MGLESLLNFFSSAGASTRFAAHALVRRGQNKNAVPAERSALSFAHRALYQRLDRIKAKR